ncbi:MAG: hypothetical protein PHP53_03075 [Prolixibacteraceae bacterium]|nr:hypothetical protein [Prolixibacteraceae bacterium]
MEIIDLRIFHNSKEALGLLNAMAGYYYFDSKIKYIVNKKWMTDFLLDQQIPFLNIVHINSFFDLKIIYGSTVILPIQRSKIDIILLRLFRQIKLTTFVHDLHFLSKQDLLKKEFVGKNIFLKKYIYLFVIYFTDNILVNSDIVKRQLKIILKKDSVRNTLKRVFLLDKSESDSNKKENRTIDYFLPLSTREYKGIWVLDRLIFENKNSTILVDDKYFNKVNSLLIIKNPYIKIIKRDLTKDSDLAKAYSSSKATLCLSRYEGFGYIPYEASSFGSIPFVFNCSAYIEIPDDVFLKLRIAKNVIIPTLDHLLFTDKMEVYSRKHIVHSYK